MPQKIREAMADLVEPSQSKQKHFSYLDENFIKSQQLSLTEPESRGSVLSLRGHFELFSLPVGECVPLVANSLGR